MTARPEVRRGLVPRRVVLVSVAVAVSLLGDSLLYVALPLQAPALGIETALVGVLLGANRLVRLISNNVAPDLYARFGGRATLIAALIVGGLTTLLYALPVGFLPLLLTRCAWGVCWSCLRLGGHLTVLDEPAASRGRLMGAFNAISRSGSLISVAAGGVLVDTIGYGPTMLWFGVLTWLGVPFAFALPGQATSGALAFKAGAGTGRASLLSAFGGSAAVRVLYTAAFLIAFVSSGLVTATLSLLVLSRTDQTAGAATISGLLLAARFICDLGLGVPLGHLSDRLGRHVTAPAGFALAGLLLLLLAAGDAVWWLVVIAFGLFAAFTALNATLDAAAGDLAAPGERAAAMGRYTTWLDAGSALGPIVGFLLVSAVGIPTLYGGCGLAFLAVALLLLRVPPRQGTRHA